MADSDWEVVIGMEVHAQLRTLSKMFCGCSSAYLEAAPNSNTCPVCLGLPGVLPVVNGKAVELVVRTGLALGATIAGATKFDRKNYFYPDLPKGYQISQYDLPIALGGSLEVGGRTVRITRIHLEEDTGKLTHAGDSLHSAQESLVDLNRAGVPLMEIVTEPDIDSAAMARDYAMALRLVLRSLGASDADMEKGQLRAEANVSVHHPGTEFGVKTELKNINSFRSLQRAVESEVKRQIGILEAGGRVAQETRGWSEELGRTIAQRTKELAQDYRYFPEPDLPPIELAKPWVEGLRSALPELPAARMARLVSDHGLPEDDARILVEDGLMADEFEATVAAGAPARAAANWIVGQSPQIPPPALAELIGLIESGVINREQGLRVLGEATSSGRRPKELVAELGLAQLSDEEALGAIVAAVLVANPQAVSDFKAGKERAIGALLAQVKEETRGTANMRLAQDLLRRRLSD